MSNWVPEECWADSLPKSRAIFAEYVRVYTGALGEPFSSEDEGTDFSCRWILDNMVTIELAGNEEAYSAGVWSHLWETIS